MLKKAEMKEWKAYCSFQNYFPCKMGTRGQNDRKIADWVTSDYFRLPFLYKDYGRGNFIIMPIKTCMFGKLCVSSLIFIAQKFEQCTFNLVK
jgi:hypothetical protein